MQRVEAGRQIATALFESENAIDTALRQTSDLIGVMSGVRLANNYAATVAAPAMESACLAIRALGEARSQIVAAHGVLDRDRALIGLGDVRLGGTATGKPVEDRPRTIGLRAVE